MVCVRVVRMDDLQAVQSFWNNNPCNFNRSAAPVGTKAFFDDIERNKYHVEPHLPVFADFKVWKDCKVKSKNSSLSFLPFSGIRDRTWPRHRNVQFCKSWRTCNCC